MEPNKIILTSRSTKAFYSFYMAKVLGLDAPESQYYIYCCCSLILGLDGITKLLTPEQIQDYETIIGKWVEIYKTCLIIRDDIKKETDKGNSKKIKDYLKLLKFLNSKAPQIDGDLIKIFVRLSELTDLKNYPIRDIEVMRARMGIAKLTNMPEMSQNMGGMGY